MSQVFAVLAFHQKGFALELITDRGPVKLTMTGAMLDAMRAEFSKVAEGKVVESAAKSSGARARHGKARTVALAVIEEYGRSLGESFASVCRRKGVSPDAMANYTRTSGVLRGEWVAAVAKRRAA